MRIRVAAGACAAFISVYAPLIASQQDVYVTLVRTHFTVSDRRGRSVTTLGRDDVTVYDNGEAKPLAEFRGHVETPLRIAVLLDRSESVTDQFPFLISAATAFERTALKSPEDLGLLVAFDSKVYLMQDWTSDRTRLAQSLRQVTPAGGTSMLDAVYKTCRDKFEISDAERNALLLVTDGEDTTSQATFDQALQMASLSRVVLYAVGIRADGSLNTREMQGRRLLSELTDLTGGRLFYPTDRSSAALTELFAQVEREIRDAYTLTYYLDGAPDGSFHRVRIEAHDKALLVHAPSGYYTRKSFGAP
jgi:Ca-activated chloride channel family protein